MHETTSYDLGDMTVVYRSDSEGRVGFHIRPVGIRPADTRHGVGADPAVAALPGSPDPLARPLDPVVHIALRGDAATAGWGQGRTMRWSGSNDRFRLQAHEVDRSADGTRITTSLATAEGLALRHTVFHREGTAHLTVDVEFENTSSEPAVIDALSSFTISGITPYDEADAAGRISVHRMRSSWSAEGRPVTETLEALHLERSWLGAANLSERFGQVGTMPTRGWFPFLAVTDTVADVTWGAHLEWSGSWQMEIARRGDDIAISGGLADREFGQWSHTVAPGGRLATPTAVISCVAGGADELADRLRERTETIAPPSRAAENDMPIAFNEWCTSWGEPDRDRVLAIADRLAGEGITYLVIDAGWYRDDSGAGSWAFSHGDWMPNPRAFPDGLNEVAAQIRARGMTPGLWFEYETVGEASAAFGRTDQHLQRDGVPMTVGGRRFWDLGQQSVREHLSDRVIGRLEEDGFGYLKIDYNEHLGLGTDHPDGLGEGLRRQILNVYDFLDTIRERLPELVIENCASGGHRLDPAMIGKTDMSSFSDAHELPEIPLIAGNLLGVVPARKMQIWSVLRASQSPSEFYTRLASTFLGRMCLSGEVLDLDEDQWQIVRAAIALYRDAAPIIASGRSRRGGEFGLSLRHPTGWQYVTRLSADGDAALVVLHTFGDAPSSAAVEIAGSWRIQASFHRPDIRLDVEENRLRFDGLSAFDGAVVVLAPA